MDPVVMDLPGWLGLAVVLGILCVMGLLAWRKERALRAKWSAPQEWTHAGTPPEGLDRALEILRPLLPGLHWGGRIRWMPAPFPDRGELLKGEVVDADDLEVWVWALDPQPFLVLAWELRRVWQYRQTGQNKDLERDPDPAWMAEVGAALAREG